MDTFNFCMRHHLFDDFEDIGDQRVIEADVREAFDAASLEAALAVLDLADIVVTDEMRAELFAYFGHPAPEEGSTSCVG